MVFLPFFLTLLVLTKGSLRCGNEVTLLPSTAKLTCDGEAMYVYVDGNQIKEVKSSNYTVVEEYQIPSQSSVLAILCIRIQKYLGAARILGVVGETTVTSGQRWVCSNQAQPAWNTTAFVDSSWPSALVYKQNVAGVLPYGMIAGISSEAQWIGTVENVTLNSTLYCRLTLCPVKACSSFFAKRIDNYRLVGHVFFSFAARSLIECALQCGAVDHADRCHSFNYIAAQKASCELNNSTQLMKPEYFESLSGAVHYYKTIT